MTVIVWDRIYTCLNFTAVSQTFNMSANSSDPDVTFDRIISNVRAVCIFSFHVFCITKIVHSWVKCAARHVRIIRWSKLLLYNVYNFNISLSIQIPGPTSNGVILENMVRSVMTPLRAQTLDPWVEKHAPQPLGHFCPRFKLRDIHNGYI